MEKQIHDVIVLGAGIMGSCTAYNSALAGRNPLILEQFSSDHTRGSSHGQSRIIRYSHADPAYMSIMKESYEMWDRLAKVSGERLINKCGLLRITDNEEEFLNMAKIMKDFGAPHRLFHGDEIQREFPQFRYGSNFYGLLDTEGGIIYADKCLKVARDEAVKHGAQFRFEEKVIKIKSDDDCVHVVTDKNTYSTRNLAITAGGWLNKVIPDMNALVKTQAGQIGAFYWTIKRNPHLFDADKKCPTVGMEENGVGLYMLPPVDYDGQIKLCIDECEPIDPDSPLKSIPPHREQQIMKHIADHLPDIDASKPSKTDLCVYTMTKDSHYAIGRYPSDPRIVIAGGFSGTGFKLAITVGRMLTALTAGDNELEIVPELFRLTRSRVGDDKSDNIPSFSQMS